MSCLPRGGAHDRIPSPEVSILNVWGQLSSVVWTTGVIVTIIVLVAWAKGAALWTGLQKHTETHLSRLVFVLLSSVFGGIAGFYGAYKSDALRAKERESYEQTAVLRLTVLTAAVNDAWLLVHPEDFRYKGGDPSPDEAKAFIEGVEKAEARFKNTTRQAEQLLAIATTDGDVCWLRDKAQGLIDLAKRTARLRGESLGGKPETEWRVIQFDVLHRNFANGLRYRLLRKEYDRLDMLAPPVVLPTPGVADLAYQPVDQCATPTPSPSAGR